MFKKRFVLKPMTLWCVVSWCFLQPAQTWSAPHQTDIATSHSVKTISSISQIAPPGVELLYASMLNTLYRNHQFQPFWQDRTAVNAFERQLAEVTLAGVNPQFERWLSLLNRNDIQGMARDAVLSDAMLGYLQFVTVAPNKGESWLYGQSSFQLATPSNALTQRWLDAVSTDHINGFIASLEPQHPLYSAMQRNLQQLLKGSQDWPNLRLTRIIRPGDSDPAVVQLREILQRGNWISTNSDNKIVSPSENVSKTSSSTERRSPLNHSTNTPSADNPQSFNTTETYTPDLVEGVKAFQQWQGLAADGVIGVRTRDWLATTPKQRAVLLALNMQRLRLLPDDTHNGIMVNIPNYSLKFYDNGKTILSSRVIVGRADRKTPLMRSALNSVVLNPPWNIPDSLLKNDLLPKVKADPSYLQKHDYVVLSGWGADAQVLDPQSIDWRSVSAQHFPYRIRQSAGPQSALGRFKFNMPTSDAIYLHDTPNHALFQRDVRALSSGCVRVNKAADLAILLLKNVGWDAERVRNAIKQPDTRVVSIQRRIPVNLYYLTAWSSEQGKPEYRTDIYNYDKMASRGLMSVNLAANFF